MKAADLDRSLVVCALDSDLYCTGYNPRQPLEKTSNLARTAAGHRLDTAKIATSARTELSKKPKALKPKRNGGKNYGLKLVRTRSF
jgi:hypothetical protein